MTEQRMVSDPDPDGSMYVFGLVAMLAVGVVIGTVFGQFILRLAAGL